MTHRLLWQKDRTTRYAVHSKGIGVEPHSEILFFSLWNRKFEGNHCYHGCGAVLGVGAAGRARFVWGGNASGHTRTPAHNIVAKSQRQTNLAQCAVLSAPVPPMVPQRALWEHLPCPHTALRPHHAPAQRRRTPSTCDASLRHQTLLPHPHTRCTLVPQRSTSPLWECSRWKVP